MQVRYFFWVVYYTCKTLFILYLQTHITRNFIYQNHKNNCIFLPPVQHNSRPLRSVDQYKIYTGHMWIMCAIFIVCFKFLTLSVFEISSTKKIIKLEKYEFFSEVWIKFLIATFDRSFQYFDKSQFRNVWVI